MQSYRVVHIISLRDCFVLCSNNDIGSHDNKDKDVQPSQCSNYQLGNYLGVLLLKQQGIWCDLIGPPYVYTW